MAGSFKTVTLRQCKAEPGHNLVGYMTLLPDGMIHINKKLFNILSVLINCKQDLLTFIPKPELCFGERYSFSTVNAYF